MESICTTMEASIKLRQQSEVLCLFPEDSSQASKWDLLVDQSSMPDVYYRPGYALAYNEISQGKAVGTIVSAGGVRALFPLLLRPLAQLSFAPSSRACDAVTPYGYGGFLLLDGVKQISSQQATKLLAVLREWCFNERIVSVYVRLHPLLQQENWFESSDEKGIATHHHGWTAAVDTAICGCDEQMRAVLGSNRRRDLERGRKNLSLSWSSEGRDIKEDLDAFHSVYEERMEELNAEQYYRFPARYYDALAKGLGSQLEVGLAWHGNEVVGGALFFAGKLYWHYHLGGTNEVGRKYGASTLLMCEAARRAFHQGCRYLHMGGGLRGDDTLLAYKRSYGGPLFRYAAVSLICDPKAYAELQVLRNASTSGPSRAGYFPAYRG